MTKNIFIAAVLTGFVANVASAQTLLDNLGAADTAVTDLEEQIADDRDRDLAKFGNEGREIGTYGSVALRGTSTSNDDSTSTSVGIGLRYGSFDGVNGLDVTISYAYAEEDGVRTEDSLLGGVDYRRDLTPNFFAYGQLAVSTDKLSTTSDELLQDMFVGAGVGYRIFNGASTQWSVQAGPGYRVGQIVGGLDFNEAAASASSNFYKSLSDTMYITNDTDVIYSETATTVSNELALNVSLTDTLSLRTSYASEFNPDTDTAFKDGKNTLGVSAVYNF